MTQTTHFPGLGGDYVRETVDECLEHSEECSAHCRDRPQIFLPHGGVLCCPMTRLWLTGIPFVNLLRTGLLHSHSWLVCLLCSRIIDFLFFFFFSILKKSGPEGREWRKQKYLAFIFHFIAQHTGWQSPDCHQKAPLSWWGHQVTN